MKTTNIYVIEPEEGNMLFNGTDYSDKVFTSTPEQWNEVPMEQYEEWFKKQNTEIVEINE